MNDITCTWNQSTDSYLLENKNDLLQYFNKNGFKECQVQNLNDNTQINKCLSIKAWDQELTKYVIIKIVKGDNLSETEKQINKIQEIQCQFLQKYIRVKQNIEQRFLYYSIDFHNKINLLQFSRTSKLNIDLVERIICKILIALQQLHQNNLFHRRIKLENILIDENESIKLTDYGINDDDNYLFDNKQNLNISLNDLQLQDYYRTGIIIIFLCDILREKERSKPQYIRYNTNRCYKLNIIASQLMNSVQVQTINIKEILQNLNYFEGIYQSVSFGFYVYEGEMKDGQKHGRGIARYSNGSISISTWKDNKKQNNGIIYYKNDNICEKDFSDESNQGKIYWAEKESMYEGELQGFKMNGIGVLIRNKQIYKGLFTNGKMNSYGEIYKKNGDIYKGNLKNSKKNGIGTYTWKTGSVYIGNWDNGEMTGFGCFKQTDGTETNGEYKNGKLNGHGVIYWTNGNYYEGQFKDNRREGKGKFYISASQTLYEGEFKNNNKHGYGKQTSQVYGFKEGYWKNNIYQSDQQVNEKNGYKCIIF